jgi:mono/diheme cytochrome c family protein
MICLLAVALAATLFADEEAWVAPTRAAKKKNPVPANDASLARGEALYVKECLSCHGAKGKGDGPAARELEKHPGDLTSPKLREQSDGALFWKLTRGRKPMPSVEKIFTEEDRWQVINYIRTFAPKSPR